MSFGGFEYGDGGFGGGTGGVYGGSDAMGGYGGSGYMEGGFGGNEAAGFGASQSPDGKGKNRNDQNLLYSTIKQLMDSNQDQPDDSFKVDGIEVHQVCIVGCVVEKNDRSTNTQYIIEDGTGRMEAMLYNDDSGDNPIQEERRNRCGEGRMVRAIGNFREFQGKKHILAFDVSPIEDFNQVTKHFLEVIYTHCMNKKGPLQPDQPLGAQNTMQSPQKFGSVGGPNTTSFGSPSAGRDSFGSNINYDMGNTGFTDLQNRVLRLHRDNDSETGVAKSYCIQVLGQEGFSPQQVQESINFLSNEGHLYSTIDEDHYKCT